MQLVQSAIAAYQVVAKPIWPTNPLFSPTIPRLSRAFISSLQTHRRKSTSFDKLISSPRSSFCQLDRSRGYPFLSDARIIISMMRSFRTLAIFFLMIHDRAMCPVADLRRERWQFWLYTLRKHVPLFLYFGWTGPAIFKFEAFNALQNTVHP